MRLSNYDKFPATRIEGVLIEGWDRITDFLSDWSGSRTIAVDLYPGTHEREIIDAFSKRFHVVDTRTLMLGQEQIRRMTAPFMTDDVLFGHVSCLTLDDYFDRQQVQRLREELSRSDRPTALVGSGAARIAPPESPVIYCDMPRWEIQQRFRRHEVMALGLDNRQEAVSLQYKRGYFNDWRICDRYKESLFGAVAYWIDTTIAGSPKMTDAATFMRGIDATAGGPFRVVPFFDPAPWGGQWMKEVCGLDRDRCNYGWCFDCVPEENSLYFNINGTLFEIPSVDLVLLRSRQILGEAVEARFGKDFPIRFDFLDTVGGGNLSLQVHPTLHYAFHHFGIHYTQDESYYLLDATEQSTVYLGLKRGVRPQEMIGDLERARDENRPFDTERYVNRFPARKHDHFLIPAGTVHCSGAGSMVLEISATPNLFTFKLWDWQRLGLDGKPRPINIERGRQVIDWSRDTDYVEANLHNRFELLASGDGWREEKTGLHPNEFIETRRHWFSVPVRHRTGGSVNVLNLVEGEEAVVSSPAGAFAPFVVHYAETFIIPAAVDEYCIAPCGVSRGRTCATIKAFVKY